MNQLNRKKISITGDLGSGKSLISQLLHKHTQFKVHSTGSIQREIAARHGISTLELNKLSEKNADIDKEIDDFTKNLDIREDAFIIDSRMAWFFIPNSFKIYLKVNTDVAASRILGDKSRKNEDYPDLEKARKDIIKRKKSEIFRFKKYYQVDLSDLNHYDLVIDTSFSKPEDVIEVILKYLTDDNKSEYKHKYWFSPRLLYPTQSLENLKKQDTETLKIEKSKIPFDFRQSVEVVVIDEQFFIFKGHEQVSKALMNNISLIPIIIKASDDQEIQKGISIKNFLSKNVSTQWISDWEKYHQFSFFVNPTL